MQDVRPSAAAVVPIPQGENTSALTPAGEEAQAAPSTARNPTATADIIVHAKESWPRAYKAMMNVAPLAAVTEPATAVMEMTAKYWTFKATDAVEGIITKCAQHMPLMFANPRYHTAHTETRGDHSDVGTNQTTAQGSHRVIIVHH